MAISNPCLQCINNWSRDPQHGCGLSCDAHDHWRARQFGPQWNEQLLGKLGEAWRMNPGLGLLQFIRILCDNRIEAIDDEYLLRRLERFIASVKNST